MSTRDSISKVNQKADVEGGEDIDDEDDDWFVYYNKNHKKTKSNAFSYWYIKSTHVLMLYFQIKVI